MQSWRRTKITQAHGFVLAAGRIGPKGREIRRGGRMKVHRVCRE
jgi:hypothetical protein